MTKTERRTCIAWVGDDESVKHSRYSYAEVGSVIERSDMSLFMVTPYFIRLYSDGTVMVPGSRLSQ